MFVFFAVSAAIIPTLCYTFLIWWLDRYEKEPISLLVAAFLWGSLPAVILAIILTVVLETPTTNVLLGPGTAWRLAPLIEEPIKAIALIVLFLFARGEFDGSLDGIVYGALVGFGFSMTENLLFFLTYPANFGGLFWLRGVLFGFNHAFFTSIVGLALGAVRYAPQRWLGYVATPLALLLAIILHGIHNAAVHYQLIGLTLSWIVQSSGISIVFIIALLTWRRERRWMELELREEIVLGTINATEYADAISTSRRTRALTQALLSGNIGYYRLRYRLYHIITELAFCKYQLRVGDRFQDDHKRDRLRQEISALRAILAGDRLKQTLSDKRGKIQ